MLEHQEYLEAVRELTDWLMTAGEELQHWSDTSGDSASVKKKLSEVRVRKSVIYKHMTLLTVFITLHVLHTSLHCRFILKGIKLLSLSNYEFSKLKFVNLLQFKK